MGDDDQHEDEMPLSREAALAWLRAIRAELAAIPVEPPTGRRRGPPPPPRRRSRLPGAPEPPIRPQESPDPEIGPLSGP